MEREGTLADLFGRLDRERQAADRQYNDALTALDRALLDLQKPQSLPSPPVVHDASQVERLNRGWKIVEMGAAASLFARPQHPYTRALLSAIPVPDPDAPPRRISLDPASFNHGAALKQIADGHWAAV